MAYAKNYLAVHFKLAYVNADGDISNYYPDFVVKVSDKKTFIIETKGLEDLDVPLKMRRLRQWCEDINRAQTDVAYDCIYVDEDSFEQYKPIMAMADRTDVEVLDASRECFSRNGGDGGGPELQFPTIPILVRFLAAYNDARSSNMETGFWIREKRLALGINQLQLAKRIGVHGKTVQAWENGESSPRPYNRQLLEIQLIGHPR